MRKLQRRRPLAKPSFLAALALALTVGSPGANAADVEPLRLQVKNIIGGLARDCRYDLETYCSTVAPGEGRLVFCLMAHADKRSLECEAGLGRARREAETIVAKSVNACEGDIAKLCSGTEPGEGRLAQCLLDQQSSLSEPCAEVVTVVERVVFPESNQPETGLVDAAPVETPDTPAAVSQTRAADEIIAALDTKVAAIIEDGKKGCAKDLETFCSTVTPGEGRLVLCLVAHADQRSSQCESALAKARSDAEQIINDVNRSVAACTPDVQSRCSGTEPGEGRIAACLMEQRDVLSDRCGTVLDKLAKVIFPPRNEPAADAAAASVTQAPLPASAVETKKGPDLAALESKVQSIIDKGKQSCAADLDKFCSTVTPGEGRLALCLVAHADKRSSQCEGALAEARAEAEKLIMALDVAAQSCSPDIAALCAGTEPGEGRIALCLAEHGEALTVACGDVLDRVGKIIFAPSNAAVAPAGAAGPPTADPAQAPVGAPPPGGEKQCQTVEATVTDLGEGNATGEARKAMRSKAKAFAASRGLKNTKSGGGSVSCQPSVNSVLSGYFTCRARTQVCWEPAGDANPASGTTP